MYAEKNIQSKQNKQTIKRKNNPDYEAAVVHTRDGVKQTIYRKKANKDAPKKNKGTPEKRRGGFKAKAKGNVGQLAAPPTIASSMAKPIASYSSGNAQKQALFQQDYLERLSGKVREIQQGEFKAKKQVKQIKRRNRPNPNAGGGGDGRT